MAIKIITDSSADIPADEIKQLNVSVIPLRTVFGDKEYLDNVTMTNEQFYQMLEDGGYPKTCQITPYEYQKVFAQATENGDEVVCLTLSGELSGTAHNAQIAAEEFDGKVFAVDSLNATAGLHILVCLAASLRDQGLSAQEIAEQLQIAKKKVRLYAVIDTLEYLKKGGRISATIAFAGTLLNIKPIITVHDGKVEVIAKARGMKNAQALLNQYIDKTNGIDYSKPYGFIYSGVSDDALQKYKQENPQLWQGNEVMMKTSQLGSTIGTHIGPGAVGIAFFEK